MASRSEQVHDAALTQRARVLAAEAEARALPWSAKSPTTLERLGRAGALARQGVVRKGREVIQEHWDVGVFDVGFGSIKAFGVYPALFFSGLTWLIPVLEIAFLNTQLWTAGYLLLRGKLLSWRGKRRYGHSLEALESYRAERLGITPTDATSIHHFFAEGQHWVLRMRRSRLRHRWIRFRRGSSEPNVLVSSELRGLVGNQSLLFFVNRHRNNPALYERILLARILGEASERAQLLSRLEPEEGLPPRDAALRDLIGEQGSALAVSRVVAAGNQLVDELDAGLGSGFSATALALRWLYWSYQRKIYRRLAEEDRITCRVLADAMDRAASPGPAETALERSRLETREWIAAMELYGRRAGAVRSVEEAQSVLRDAIATAYSRGLPVRLARFGRALSPTRWRLSTRPAEAPLPPDWRELEALEAELVTAWTLLAEAGQGYSGLRSLFEKADEAASERLAAADMAQAEFTGRLDDYLRVLHAAHVQQVRADLGRAVDLVWRFYGPSRSRSLRREHQRIERLGTQYLELEGLYGTPRDHQRIACFQRFHARSAAFSEKLRRLDPSYPPPRALAFADRIERARRAVVLAFRRAPAALRLVSQFAALLGVVLSKRERGEGTPFTRHVDAFFRALGELQGLRIEVEGAEYLEGPEANANGVQIYAPAHRHGMTDNITFAALERPDYHVFNAVDQLPLLPRWLKRRIAETPGLIAVGGGRGSSIGRALEALSAGRSRNLLIYPEGSVSEGLRGTRPVRSGFGTGLVTRLLEAGREVRIVPVTYLDNARFLDLPLRSRDAAAKRRRVVVSPALEPEAVAGIVAARGGQMLERLVRVAWLESFVTDPSLWLGMERIAGLRRRLDTEFEGARYWGNLDPAPAADLLEPSLCDEPLAVAEEPFYGRRVRVFRLPDAASDDTGVIPLRNLDGRDPYELILGIRDPAHIYLAVGSQRFDGDIFRPLRVRRKDSIYRGIAIRFTGVPERAVQGIRAELERLVGRERRTLTCSHSATKLIARAANLRIDHASEFRPALPSHVFPTRTIRRIIEYGVLDHCGESISLQIYKTDDRSLEEILEGMRSGEWRIVLDHLRILLPRRLRG